MSQSMFGSSIFYLWIRKSNPDLAYFIFSKSMIDQLYLRSQKPNIGQIIFNRSFGASTETSSFDINTNKIFLRKSLSQSHGVFTFSATQLQNNGIVIFKKIFVPVAFEIEVRYHLFSRRLNYIFKRLILSKSFDFIFPHDSF